MTFVNYLDRKGALVKDGFGVSSYPQTLFISADGKLLHREIGARDWADDEALMLVKNLVKMSTKTMVPADR